MSDAKKEKVVGFRIDEFNSERLDALSNSLNKKKSTIMREALITHLYRNTSQIPIILWGRNEFAFSFNCMDDNQIEELAKLTYNNGVKNIEYLIKTFISEEPDSLNLNLRHFLRILLKFTITDLMNWFDSIDLNWIKKKKTLRIIANHSINEKFSLYIKCLLENYIGNQTFIRKENYALTKEVLLDDLIILEFTNKKLEERSVK